MIKMFSQNFKFHLVAVVLVMIIIPSWAAASSTFTLSPAKLELKLGAGESVIRNIYIANKTGQTAKFKIEVEDIAAGKDPSDAVEFYGQNSGPYSLKSYVLISDNEIELQNGESRAIPVMFSLPYDIKPGGLYGAVLFSLINPEKSGASARISTRLGSLIFLRVKGAVSENGSVMDFSLLGGNKVYNGKPLDFQLVYENVGNVYLNPYGYVEIQNNLTKKIDHLKISPYFIFPNSTRMKEITWSNPHFGYYTATLHLNKGYGDQIVDRSYTFWVLPVYPLIIILIMVALVVFSYKTVKKLKNNAKA
jgi:hypothetical protein